jgi:hypothetical protein
MRIKLQSNIAHACRYVSFEVLKKKLRITGIASLKVKSRESRVEIVETIGDDL